MLRLSDARIAALAAFAAAAAAVADADAVIALLAATPFTRKLAGSGSACIVANTITTPPKLSSHRRVRTITTNSYARTLTRAVQTLYSRYAYELINVHIWS